MKMFLFVASLFFLVVNGSLPTPIPPNFGKTSHIISSFENNVTETDRFYFNCPYNDPDITITNVAYKFQSNSSDFKIWFYNGNNTRYNSSDPEHTNNTYWQIIGQQCSYYCEVNYTLNFDASQCFIFSGFDPYNDTMLISYEIVEEYLGPMPKTPVDSPSSPPENPNPPDNGSDEPTLSPGVIAGIVLGCLAFVGILVGISIYFVKKYDMCNRNVSVN